ncbi:MAG: Integral membrane protein, partial [uncultured Nocardioides sp.]
ELLGPRTAPSPGRPGPDRAAARRSAGTTSAPADRRSGPVRRLAGHDGAGHARAGAVGRPSLGFRPARPDVARAGGRAVQLPGAAAVDPAPGEAGHRDDRQRRHRRYGGRRGPGGAGRARCALAAPGAARRGRRAQRPGDGALHRLAVRSWSARRSHDGSVASHRPVPPPRPHGARGHRRGHRAVARWRPRGRHGPLCPGDRPARAADAARVHGRGDGRPAGRADAV